MNLRVLLLLGFTVLNAVLLAAFVTQPSLLPPSVRDHLSPRESTENAVPARTNAAAAQAPATSPAPPGELWSALHSTDLATLVQRMRAAGFPPTIVRAVVDAEVQRQFNPRLKELMRSVTETPYWTQDPGFYTGSSKVLEAVNQIYRERARVLRELLGKDAFAFSGIDPTVAQRRQFGNLSAAKIDLVQRIADDYADMSGQLRSAMQGITLPEDREKFALLEREKRADLAAVLTPEELADYEMRTSPITNRLRTAFSILDATEAEFRAIYASHEPFKDVLYPTSTGGMVYIGGEVMEKRRAATQQIHEQLKTALGSARFLEYQRATDNEFQQLYRLGQRDNVPTASLVQAYEARGPAAEASMAIVQNPALDPAAKQAALKQLAQDTRTRLLSTLGPSMGPTYVQNARWLSYLEQGRAFSVGPDGSLSLRSALPLPSAQPPPSR